MAGTSTYAQLEGTAVTAMGATGALDTAAVFLVAVDDGTDTGLWQFTSADGIDNATVVAEVELIGILKGRQTPPLLWSEISILAERKS